MKFSFYILTALLLLAGANSLLAQEYYTMSYSTGAYKKLVGGVTIPGLDTNDYGLDLEGFQMEVYGSPMVTKAKNSVVFFREGYVDIPFQYADGTEVALVIETFYSFLVPRDATSGRIMLLESVGDEEILKFEWRNMGLRGHPAGDFVNFQLWLNTSDNSIEVHMGPNHVTATDGYISNTGGPMIGLNLMSATFTQLYYTIHLAGPADHPIAENSAISTLTGTPPEGAIYKFVYSPPASVIADAHAVSGVSFHPNPFRESTQIELPEDLNGTVMMVVHDLLGREMYRMEKATSGDHIPRGSLPAGVYLVTLQHEGRSRFGGRLVITE